MLKVETTMKMIYIVTSYITQKVIGLVTKLLHIRSYKLLSKVTPILNVH